MFGCGHESEIAYLRDLVKTLQEQNKALSEHLAVIAEPALRSRLTPRQQEINPPTPSQNRPRSVLRSPKAFRDGARVDIPDPRVFLTPSPGLPEAN